MAAKLRRGDRVAILAGKDKGKEGRILSINHKKGRIIVEGANMVKKHRKAAPENPQGGVTSTEAPLHISNVAYLHKGKAVRVGFTIEGGVKKRVARPSGDIID